MERDDLSETERAEIKEILDYWRTENTSYKVRSAYSSQMERIIPSDNWMKEPGMVFPLYRLCGAYIDYAKLVKLGIPGLRSEIETALTNAEQTGGDVELFRGMLIALKVLAKSCNHYACEAYEQAKTASESRRTELLVMAKILEKLPNNRPETFQEALQLMWIYSIVSMCATMDVWMPIWVIFWFKISKRAALPKLTPSAYYNPSGSLWRIATQLFMVGS